MTLFIRLLEHKEKGSSLSAAISSLNKSEVFSANCTFHVNPKEFKNIPSSPYAYWVSSNVRESYTSFSPVENDVRIVRQGLATAEDFRFVRNWWEVKGELWCPFAKGGDYSPYYSDLHLVTKWGDSGKEIKAGICNRYPYLNGNANFVAKNSQHYFRAGITWSRRTTSGLSMRVMPHGSVFGDKGPALLTNADDENELLVNLGIMSSAAYKYIVSLQLAAADAAARSYEVGIIQNTPIPDINIDIKTELLTLVHEAIDTKTKLDFVNETSHSFVLPELLLQKLISYSPSELFNKLKVVQQRIDEIGFEIYNFNDRDKSLAHEQEGSEYKDPDISKTISMSRKEKISLLLEWSVGVVFGYFSTCPNDINQLNLKETSPFNMLSKSSPAMLTDEKSAFFSNQGIISGNKDDDNNLGSLLKKLLKKTDIDLEEDLDKWLQKDFFNKHLKKYSKSRRQAPIFWPLEDITGSFKLWLAYHKLNSQTLLNCINDFVQPKLDKLTKEYNQILLKAQRNIEEEKQLDLIIEEKESLENFKEEMLRISAFWQPNLNDGIQIIAAPLWRLFQHIPWQKKLKQTWEKLQDGEYDWAHLAFSTWPERVLKKCHADRSLAIAHDVENDLWHEVEVIKKNKKEPVWEWQPKPFGDAELHAYIKEKIATDERLKLYRSNQANNLNGGKL
ncbi:hypothetical protein Q4567_06395 [Aliiglaciecola sp. 2_MG-2023]|uniref:hypothetical protein n=1 Tax=unclassified Aliiglaciecola TaxID=2593648 RepID=UPI0026E431DE|nr:MULTISPECIES: hypothetical protein [unclassified Aliiglaciecola]MDO6710340.1 hypothetical protein [Aliiglaciecola sp. 2_MG-2023]MDO6751487.1 hypothetical protein [Aliiglaciecola sp. 1_MG-2023]